MAAIRRAGTGLGGWMILSSGDFSVLRSRSRTTSPSLCVLLLCPLLFSGCLNWHHPLEMESSLEAPSLLVSEVLAADDRTKLVSCPIKIVNYSSETGTVKLLRTGCSCYGITLDGKKLANGDVISIPKDGSQQLQIQVRPAVSHTEKHYTADFSILNPEGQTRQVSVRCRLKVYSDVRLLPSVLTMETSPKYESIGEYSIVIEHVFRSQSSEAPLPEFQQLPEFMKVLSLEKFDPPEQLEDDLWRQKWEAIVGVKLPEDFSESPDPMNFHVSLQNPGSQEPVAGQGTLLVHKRQSVVFPNRVHFGKIAVGATKRRRILLSSSEEDLFHLYFSAIHLPPFLTVETSGMGGMDELDRIDGMEGVSIHEDGRYWLEISATPTSPGPFSETVSLRTDLYDVSEINIHVDGVAEISSEKSLLDDDESNEHLGIVEFTEDENEVYLESGLYTE